MTEDVSQDPESKFRFGLTSAASSFREPHPLELIVAFLRSYSLVIGSNCRCIRDSGLTQIHIYDGNHNFTASRKGFQMADQIESYQILSNL